MLSAALTRAVPSRVKAAEVLDSRPEICVHASASDADPTPLGLGMLCQSCGPGVDLVRCAMQHPGRVEQARWQCNVFVDCDHRGALKQQYLDHESAGRPNVVAALHSHHLPPCRRRKNPSRRGAPGVNKLRPGEPDDQRRLRAGQIFVKDNGDSSGRTGADPDLVHRGPGASRYDLRLRCHRMGQSCPFLLSFDQNWRRRRRRWWWRGRRRPTRSVPGRLCRPPGHASLQASRRRLLGGYCPLDRGCPAAGTANREREHCRCHEGDQVTTSQPCLACRGRQCWVRCHGSPHRHGCPASRVAHPREGRARASADLPRRVIEFPVIARGSPVPDGRPSSGGVRFIG